MNLIQEDASGVWILGRRLGTLIGDDSWQTLEELIIFHPPILRS